MCVVASTATCEGTCTALSGWSCRMDDDCSAQEFCAAALMQGLGLWGSGVCETIVPPGAIAGDICGTPVQCAPGLFCVGGPAPARCAADLGTGAPCGEGLVGATCAPGLACVTLDDGTTATCMPPATLGDSCISLFQCGAQYELSDIICDETGTHTCVHRPSTGPCSVVRRMNTCDPTTSYCEAVSGTCRPWLSPGEPCVFPLAASIRAGCGTAAPLPSARRCLEHARRPERSRFRSRATRVSAPSCHCGRRRGCLDKAATAATG